MPNFGKVIEDPSLFPRNPLFYLTTIADGGRMVQAAGSLLNPTSTDTELENVIMSRGETLPPLDHASHYEIMDRMLSILDALRPHMYPDKKLLVSPNLIRLPDPHRELMQEGVMSNLPCIYLGAAVRVNTKYNGEPELEDFLPIWLSSRYLEPELLNDSESIYYHVFFRFFEIFEENLRRHTPNERSVAIVL